MVSNLPGGTGMLGVEEVEDEEGACSDSGLGGPMYGVSGSSMA